MLKGEVGLIEIDLVGDSQLVDESDFFLKVIGVVEVQIDHPGTFFKVVIGNFAAVVEEAELFLFLVDEFIADPFPCFGEGHFFYPPWDAHVVLLEQFEDGFSIVAQENVGLAAIAEKGKALVEDAVDFTSLLF